MTRNILQLLAFVILAACSEWWPSRVVFVLIVAVQAAVVLAEFVERS